MLLDKSQQEQVAACIVNAEKNTDAELVAVLARRSDNYYYIPLLWAALLALLSPIPITFAFPAWLTTQDVWMLQIGSFLCLSIAIRIPAVMMSLVPRSVKHWRASNLARRQFLENNLHHTAGETGVLLFVSEAEHYVEIIADRGISKHVSNEQWQQIVTTFTQQVKAGQTLDGFLTCINACAALLAEHAPATGDKDELPNRLVII